MTLQDLTPSMGFWVFLDPMVKRGKEMKVRKFLVIRGKKKHCLSLGLACKKYQKSFEKKKKLDAIKPTLLNLQLQH